MRCLMCGTELGESSLRDILIGEDPICSYCRRQWTHLPQRFKVNGVKGESDYLYYSGFSSCLIQYKECGDEALKDVFLFEVKKKLAGRYHGWTLCLMPSTAEKVEKRGFSHLRKMYEGCGLAILEPFEKRTDGSQKERNYLGRQEMKNAVTLKQGIELPEKIVLCDDVITTGATLKGALNCLDLSAHQVRIYAAAADSRGIIRKKWEEWS